MNARALMRKLLLLATLLSLALAAAPGYAQSTAGDDDDDSPGSESLELKGLVESAPAAGRIGEWRVAGTVFTVTADTVFMGFGDGRPGVGRCVEVELTAATPPVALELKPDDDCGAPGLPGEQEWRGRVTAAPAGGFVGAWTIGGKAFVTTEATFFEGFGETPPAVGACVEVEYIVEGGANLATKLHPEDGCGAGGAPGEDHLFRGRVDVRPTGSPATRNGAWVIGGKSFVAVEAGVGGAATVFTGFGDDLSRPAAGDCVAVNYRERDDVRTMLVVRAATCERPDRRDGEAEAHGPLTARPEAREGTWTIGGIDYTATATVELKADFGPLVVKEPPVCVKVHYSLGEAGARVAREIESRPAFRCEPSAQERELYGEVRALPPSPHIGTWLVGTVEVQVTRATRLEDGPFAVGRLVKVKFTRAGDGTLLATKIEGKGTPDRGDDRRERGRGKSYGKIEVLGAVPGDWTIAGQVYAVTAATRLRDGGTPFAAGSCVEVHYRAEASGARTAVKIEREGCGEIVDGFGRAYGSVDAMPAAGYTGTWTIGGVAYEAVAATEFEFEAGVGAPTVGSYVEVKYVVEGDRKVAREISTHVPPGMGDDSYVGRLVTAAAPAGLAAAAISWKVGPVAFLVTDATIIQDGASIVEDGATVRVNGYRDASGALVATEVAAVTAVHLPLVAR